MVIDEVYTELKKRKLCRNGFEFSRNFLGKADSYYSVIKKRQDEVPIGVYAVLEYALSVLDEVEDLKHSVEVHKNTLIREAYNSKFTG